MRTTALLLVTAVAACQAGDADLGSAEGAYEETAPSLWCGTVEPSANLKLAAELEASRIPAAHQDANRGAQVAVHVHVIQRGRGAANGEVSDEMIRHQLAVLDAAYAPIGFSFDLASIDRTTSATWFAMTPGSEAEASAKAALRRGSARDLNLYLAAPGNGFLGYATFPAQYTAAPRKDGVVLLHATLPGGAAAPYNLGDQAVHEVGHWLGLYHTYQDDCGGNGDFVDDTAATSAPAFGCPMGRSTCGDGHEDPVRNYMDRSDDLCMNGFTAGQATRINTQFNAYRRNVP